jgi:formylglycine-generating enzyme required for sulfatase activity
VKRGRRRLAWLGGASLAVGLLAGCGGSSSSGSSTVGDAGASGGDAASPEVQGGTYFRSFSYGDGGTATDEAHPASISSFRLDRNLVSVGRFRAFVVAALAPDGGLGWSPTPGSGKHGYLNGGSGLSATGGAYEPGWSASYDVNVAPTDANLSCDPSFATWTASPADAEDLPINCVNWYEAVAFCIWDAGFLPSESEWGYAAAGGTQQREYAWGENAPGTDNLFAIYGCNYPDGSGECSGNANVAPVGTAPQGAALWGQLDLGGDVSEWTLDTFAPYSDPCADCTNADAGATRVIRGADFSHPATYLLTTYRFGVAPELRNQDVGFRCARSP